MIGRLRGIIIEKQPPKLLLELNHGLAYEVQVPLSVFADLPSSESVPVILHTHLSVREDAMTLYGFLQVQERNLFRELIKVNGVGPKLALAVLSSMDVAAFIQCIDAHDTTTLVRLPGVGKKTAERLIIEMRDRFQEWSVGSATLSISSNQRASTPSQEAISALLSLGYKPQEASRLIAAVDDAQCSVEELIRLALRQTTY